MRRDADDGDAPSSDEGLNNAPDMQQYRSHLAQLYPDSKHASFLVEPDQVDDDMLSDDDVDADMADGGEDEEQSEDEEEDEDNEEDGAADDEDEDVDANGDGEQSGDDMDAQAETDEEMTLYLKPQEEREEIEQEIVDLEEAVPQLAPDYKVIDRLGTGTFSSVYKAIDVQYHKWYNAPWHGFHPPSSSAYYQSEPHPSDTKVFVAVKPIYVTSGPERIRNEISIMEDCRGCRHVSQLITAFRERDQVVAIMPYHRNMDFRVSQICLSTV